MGLKGKSVLSIKCGVTNHSMETTFGIDSFKKRNSLYFKQFLPLKTLVVEKVDSLTFRVIGNPTCLRQVL